MKKFKGFFRTVFSFFQIVFLIFWFLLQTVFKPVIIILLFWLISFAVGFFTGSARITIVIWCLGMLVMSLILIIPRCKELISDIFVIKKGFKYVGICNGKTKPFRGASYLNVTWTDNNNHEHTRTFNAIDNKNKYPHDVNVYAYDNIMNLTNLGWRSVIKDVGYVLVFMPFFILSVVLIVFAVEDIIKNGLV